MISAVLPLSELQIVADPQFLIPDS